MLCSKVSKWCLGKVDGTLRPFERPQCVCVCVWGGVLARMPGHSKLSTVWCAAPKTAQPLGEKTSLLCFSLIFFLSVFSEGAKNSIRECALLMGPSPCF